MGIPFFRAFSRELSTNQNPRGADTVWHSAAVRSCAVLFLAVAALLLPVSSSSASPEAAAGSVQLLRVPQLPAGALQHAQAILANSKALRSSPVQRRSFLDSRRTA